MKCVLDCTISVFKQELDLFVDSLERYDVAILYFAGHGCVYRNTNRLFAISEGAESDIRDDCVNLHRLIYRFGNMHASITLCVYESVCVCVCVYVCVLVLQLLILYW